MEVETKELTVFEKTKAIMRSEEAIERYTEALGNDQQAKRFIGSVLLVVSQSDKLMECTPKSIMVAGMRAANLKLSVDPSLGHGYIVSYKIKGVPTAIFIIGYKGLKQLAYRTGQYNFINEKIVYDGQTVEEDNFSGIKKVVGIPKYYKDGFKPIGYWMGFELKGGFRQTFYMTKEEVEEHAKRYSPTYNKYKKEWYPDSKWVTDFDDMAIKTVIRLGLGKYGYFDENALLAMAELGDFQEGVNWDDDFIDGELLDSAIDQQVTRNNDLVGDKSTKELSALLGFEDEPEPEPTLVNQAIDLGGKVKSSMSIETAENMKDSKGKRYGDMTNDELSGYSIGIGKLLAKNGLTPEKHDEYTMKQDAIKIILEARNK